jgi:hypothetical protein
VSLVALTPEFRLLADACRRSFAGADSAGPLLQDEGSIDWSRFLRTARFHRVQGLVWRALRRQRVPPPIAEALKTDAEAIAIANLRAAAGSRELLAAFDDAGVALLFVKGLTLGVLAYGGVASKSAADIDILVAEDDVARAAELLRRCGYVLVVPQADEDVCAWHRRAKESLWAKENAGLHVDLHSRLADNRALIPTLTVHSPSCCVEVSPAIALPTLTDDELFAYLAVHGASSLWFRLKWLTDFAALLHPKDGAEIERLYRRSQMLGAGRAADQGLLLADAIYGTLNDCPSLRDELSCDPAHRWLLEQALKQLAGKPEPVEPTSARLGTLRIHLAQFALLPGLRFKIGELIRQARAALS